MNDFSSLGLSAELQKVLPELGFTTPTPIQEQTIPILLDKPTDLIGLAQTGTGKTAAFGLPLLDLVDAKQSHTQAVILAPTRELCQQIAQQLEKFSKYKLRLNVLPVFGGASIVGQIAALKKPTQVIVATPGRLLDLIRRKKIDLSEIKHVVLDEADEMLNMGFQEDIDSILSSTSADKNTWLFSATMPSEIRRIIKNYMTDPQEVKVGSGNEANKNITHMVLHSRADDKLDMLKQVIESAPEMKSIIFTRTKASASELTTKLVREGYAVDALHGDLSQAQRDRVMQSFKKGRVSIILATDVAARGIDVDDLTHVMHYNLPDDLSFYTHRSGRTARAGKTGISLVFATTRDSRKLRDIERSLKIRFETWKTPDLSEVFSKKMVDWATSVAESKPNNKAGAITNEAAAVFSGLDKDELIEKLLSVELIRMGYQDAETKARNRKESRREDNSRDRDRGPRGDRGDRGDRRERRDRGDRPDRKDRERKDARKDRDRPVRSARDSDNDKDRGPKREKKSREDFGSAKKSDDPMLRFFINVGSMDGMGNKELVDFVADQAKLKSKDIGDVTIHKQHSYFEVSKEDSRGLISSFEGIQVNNRHLRVNRDGIVNDEPKIHKKKSKKKK